MAKKNKDYSKEILERIVGTKSKATLAEKFKEAFAEKYGIKREELKKGIVDKVIQQRKGGEMKLITETIEDIEVLTEATATGKNYKIRGVFMQADIKNRNGRVYPVDTLAKEVKRYNEHL